jgi:hypothetical protein
MPHSLHSKKGFYHKMVCCQNRHPFRANPNGT